MAATIIPLITAAVVIGLIAVLLMTRSRTPVAASSPDDGLRGEQRVRAYGLVLRDQLDRTPFGPDLARAVWRKLERCPAGNGLVHEFHRDFCGQGLVRTDAGVKLCDIHDGGYNMGEAIASWMTEAEFVAFFAAQSDFSCSGWDASSAVFASDDEWYRNNQRLTREKLAEFANGR